MRLLQALILTVVCFFGSDAQEHDSSWGENVPPCDTTKLRDYAFHTVTRRGIIRITIGQRDTADMYYRIGEFLQLDKNLEWMRVRPFFYNETAVIFLRYPDFRKKHEKDFYRTVAWFIRDFQRDKNDKYMSFPAWSSWTKLGEGYEYDEYQKAPNKTGLLCDPRAWFYDLNKKKFTSHECKKDSRLPWTDPMLSKENVHDDDNFYDHYHDYYKYYYNDDHKFYNEHNYDNDDYHQLDINYLHDLYNDYYNHYFYNDCYDNNSTYTGTRICGALAGQERKG
uniref:Candidate secreted effector protein n=1 Tax=Steinernema glaseri TaxID=37863 RepID=A0A1I8AGE1_9BILA